MKKVGSLRNLVQSVRGVQVMLDSDLAYLYEIEVKRLNEAAKRNPDRFPEDFMFQLTKAEWDSLRFQIGTFSSDLRSQFATFSEEDDKKYSKNNEILKSQFATSKSKVGRKYLPYVFTEQGVAMLSSVLNSPRAIQMNISIIRTFVEIRKLISQPLAKKIEDLEKVLMLHIDDTNVHLDEHTEKINAIITQLNYMLETPPKPKNKIGFTANR